MSHATRDEQVFKRLSTTGLSPSMVQDSAASSSRIFFFVFLRFFSLVVHFCNELLKEIIMFSHNPGLNRFRLFPCRSPLLRESRLLSFPPATKMFQFAGLSLSYL